MAKILLLSDTEEPYFWDFFSKDKVQDYDVIVSCGDLKAAYLEFLVTMSNKPLLYVHGNHDTKYQDNPPGGCDSIEDQVVTVKGVRIAGLGGSMRYNEEGVYMSTEQEMQKRVKKLARKIRKAGGLDLFVTHAPATGYGDREDLAHRGFACFHEILTEFQPQVMAYGHVHRDYGGFKREYAYTGPTRIINAFGHFAVDIEVPERTEEPPKRKFWLFGR